VPLAALLAAAIVTGQGPTAPPPPRADTVDPSSAPAAAPRERPEQKPLADPGGSLASAGSAGVAHLPPPEARSAHEPEELTGYVWPIRDGLITGFFAKRKDGFIVVDGKQTHEGLDITSFCGDHVRAAHDGVVLAAGRRAFEQQGFSGSMDPFFDRVERLHRWANLSISIVIDDGNGYRSVYAHLSETRVKPGDVVEAGDLIGVEGATGYATGCHLHYELIRMDGPWLEVAKQYVRRSRFPSWTRERIDPMRVFSLDAKYAPTYYWGVRPPDESPGLGRRTAPTVLEPPPDKPGATERTGPGSGP
jgi:murein DD-endopeptidase MepM/ murein hydrolase activator NlpD